MKVLWDYVTPHSDNPVAKWLNGLSKRDRDRLCHKIDYVLGADMELAVKTKALAGPLKGYRHLYKIRAAGDSALRLIVCLGPSDKSGEVTLLFGAEERDRKYEPRNALEVAEARRQELLRNPGLRRKHEFGD